MSDDTSPKPPSDAASVSTEGPSPLPGDISPEDLARLLAMSGMPGPAGPPGKSSLRRKIIIASLIAGIGVGASVMSCVGQSFSYRQAHALEGIEQQLKEIRASCPAALPRVPGEGPR
jgi:hypothetical protein